MRDILEKLYLGRIRPCEKESTGEQSEQLIQLTECVEEFIQGLIPSQQIQFRAYMEAAAKMHCDAEAACFIDGFKLGIRLILSAVAE